MSPGHWRVMIGIFRGSLVGIVVAVAGCAPLPGNSLDPVYLYMKGLGSGKASEEAAAREAKEASPAEAKSAGQTMWTGRYQDSRGGGEITMSLVRGNTTTSGTWRLRTGGGGPISMIREKGQRLQLHMENIASDCPGTFEGWVEFNEAGLIGAYNGKDCEGPVQDGRLELRPK